jgi:hypothetical protein
MCKKSFFSSSIKAITKMFVKKLATELRGWRQSTSVSTPMAILAQYQRSIGNKKVFDLHVYLLTEQLLQHFSKAHPQKAHN